MDNLGVERKATTRRGKPIVGFPSVGSSRIVTWNPYEEMLVLLMGNPRFRTGLMGRAGTLGTVHPF